MAGEIAPVTRHFSPRPDPTPKILSACPFGSTRLQPIEIAESLPDERPALLKEAQDQLQDTLSFIYPLTMAA